MPLAEKFGSRVPNRVTIRDRCHVGNKHNGNYRMNNERTRHLKSTEMKIR